MTNDDFDDNFAYIDFEATMHEKFPKMFSEPFGGFAVGRGWWPILEALCDNIQHHIDWNTRCSEAGYKDFKPVDQVVVAQIKEKFGGLRFYYDGGDDEIRGMVRMAEAWAARHCEECGKPGHQRDGGWIRTLCDEHEAERQARYKERFGDSA